MLLRPILAAGLLVVLSHAALAFAPCPTVLTVKYKNQMLPVVHVIDTDPVIVVDGKEKRIRTEPLYLTQRAPGYTDEKIDIAKMSLGGLEVVEGYSEHDAEVAPKIGPRYGMTYFEGTLKARKTQKGAFAVVIIYSPYDFALVEMDPTINPHAQVIVHDLPDLPAGQNVDVKFSAPIPNGKPKLSYLLQIYDHTGREIFTNKLSAASVYYYLRDRTMLKEAVAKYTAQFSGADHGLVPVIMPQPLLPDGSEKPSGTAIAAILDVSAKGLVNHVELEGIQDAAIQHATVEALGGWMFLPQLKSGTPVATRVKVPLRF